MKKSTTVLSGLMTIYQPDQIPETQKSSYFVRHPEQEESTFYFTNRADFIARKATYTPKTTEELKSEFYDLYQFSLKVLSKRWKISSETYFGIVAANAPLSALSPAERLDLWDQFIYNSSESTFTDANEVCTNILLADFWLNNIVEIEPEQDATEYNNAFKRKINAGIVRPEFLNFDGKKPVKPAPELSSIPEIEIQKTLVNGIDVLKAKDQLDTLNTLERELKNARSIYQRKERGRKAQYDVEFNEEYEAYLDQIRDVFTVSGEDENSGNPDIPNGRVIEPADIKPPKYNYNASDELDEALLNQNLSASSKRAITQYRDEFSNSQSDILDKIIPLQQQNQQIIADNTVNTSNPVKNIGGATVIDLGLEDGDTNIHTACSTFCIDPEENLFKIFLTIHATNVRGVQVTLLNGTEVIKSENPVNDTKSAGQTGFIVFDKGVIVPEDKRDNLSLKVVFITGRLKKMEEHHVNIPVVLQGDTVIKKVDPPVVIDPPAVNNNKPVKYGITRLGIGEYLKINQSICCYEPGEVSHIENIMQAEYKEKATKLTKRSEITDTSETTYEREQTTDTTSTDRNEISTELSTMEQQSRSYNFSAQANFGFKILGQGGGASVGTNIGINNSKEKSYTQSSQSAQELVQKATERVVSKRRDERVQKMINEYTEDVKHGYDNRKGKGHINGVYRWVDKVYKNELVSYGKRLMYEFMVPEPASIYRKLTEKQKEVEETLHRPENPAKTITDYTKLTLAVAAKWAFDFGVELEAYPEEKLYLGKSYSGIDMEGKGKAHGFNDFEIPEGYQVVSYNFNCSIEKHGDDNNGTRANLKIFDNDYPITIPNINLGSKFFKDGRTNVATSPSYYLNNKTIPVSLSTYDVGGFSINISVEFIITENAKKEWQRKAYDAILRGYENKLAEYEEKQSIQQAQTQEKVKANPNFHREIEMEALKKNCIDYLFDALGDTADENNFVRYNNTAGVSTAANHYIFRDEKFEKYAATVKFFEQAFEWEIMSYIFYPYYWGHGRRWETLYENDAVDELFRSFLKSGMARIVLTVRPGFEDIVNWYMETGEVWLGSNPPIIGDELYLSIAEELRGYVPDGVVDEWEIKVPSTLTILQTKGVELGSGSLPCFCDDDTPESFEESPNFIGEGAPEDPE